MNRRRYIVTRWRVLGTPVGSLKRIAKPLGRDHALAEALWRTGVYEARMLASMVDEPERVTAAQMDRWIRECDNWSFVDTLAFHLFDRTPHAFERVAKWGRARGEFERRAGFALLACCALHGRGQDADYLELLPLVERAASDERNFVKKGVAWALRTIGGKHSPKLRAASRALAERLAQSKDAAARFVGRDALRAFGKADAGKDRAGKSVSALERREARLDVDDGRAVDRLEPKAALTRQCAAAARAGVLHVCRGRAGHVSCDAPGVFQLSSPSRLCANV